MFDDGMVPRQIWATPTKTLATSKLTSTISSQVASALCTVALPANGVLRFNETFYLTLDNTITFESSCADQVIVGSQNSGNSTIVKFDDPFYASVAPQIYALATATIISYILVILIFITPRTFYVGGPGGGANFLGLRSLVPGSGSSSVVGVGRRPLLQKIAAVTVAISLTIATADTFRVAENQYNDGLMDSQQLVDDVIGSTEIRVVRVVSDTFLWLAQVQTLIRLYPRHKEKVTIKWLGFALVTCDTVFSILENFVSQSTLTRPRSFQDAIPALSYLFQMSISLIYASCVIYYSLSKRRFAFWHSKMRNICMVAILSLTAVLIPVVFFVLDVSQPDIATWGEYIRWVGAAAASVVVWEWVERIEALERDERKDGILGREIFDGDEMLNVDHDNKSNSAPTYFGFGKRTSTERDKKVSMLPLASVRPRMPFGKKKNGDGKDKDRQGRQDQSEQANSGVAGVIARPPQVPTPASRSNTTSAASTVYQVRYQNVSSPSPAIPKEPANSESRSRRPSTQMNAQIVPLDEITESVGANDTNQNQTVQESHLQSSEDTDESNADESRSRQIWTAVANPFKRKRAEPPAEVAAQMAVSNMRRSPAQTYHNLRDRFSAFRSSRREQTARQQGPSPPMPVTVIPAQPRNNRLAAYGETPQASMQPSLRASLHGRNSSGSRSRRESLPITIIPPPIRGGRTWSPDDLNNQEASHLTDARSSPNAAQAITSSQDIGFPANRALTGAESSAGAREPTNRNRPTSSSRRAAARLQSPNMDFLNDELSSVSPGSAAAGSLGSDGGTNDIPCEGQPRRTSNTITDTAPEPATLSRNEHTSQNKPIQDNVPGHCDESTRDDG